MRLQNLSRRDAHRKSTQDMRAPSPKLNSRRQTHNRSPSTLFCLQQNQTRARKLATPLHSNLVPRRNLSGRIFPAGIILAPKSAQKRGEGGHQTVTMVNKEEMAEREESFLQQSKDKLASKKRRRKGSVNDDADAHAFGSD